MSKPSCDDVHAEMSALIAGDRSPDLAPELAPLRDHLAGCDACRDAKHDAERLATMAARAGDDAALPADLRARVLSAIDADDAKRSASLAATEVALPKAAPAEATVPSEKSSAAPIVAIDRAKTSTRAPARGASKRLMWAAAAVVLIGGGVGVGVMATRKSTDRVADGGARTPKSTVATVSSVQSASTGQGGLSVRAANGVFAPLIRDAVIPVGAVVRTDDRTRGWLSLADGSALVLDHGTELELGADRKFRLVRGRLRADIAHIEGSRARIAAPHGDIDVTGTQFVLTAAEAQTSIAVTSGAVNVHAGSGAITEVRAGEEGVTDGGAASVFPVPQLAADLGWAELATGSNPEVPSSGLGALRAYKPGEKRDRDWSLVLAKHDVKVRIVGPLARTEIIETFRNDSDSELEGVYQFPLPPDARIDSLELDKPGTAEFEVGAFIDQDRAAKIWAGVIDKATPKLVARKPQELVWVPGPWRDPALLDWQRGGRFELKIFPIPAKGARTIKIAYTQVVNPRGGARQYTYPLPHSVDGSTAAEQFAVDVEIRGAKGSARARGYDLVADASRADAVALTYAHNAFVPKGDLVIDYRPTDGDAEVRAWTYQGAAAVAPDEDLAKTKGVGIDAKVVEAQRAIAADLRPTVVMALRPQLPRATETRPRDFAIVVDRSQSMVGERHKRAVELVTALVTSMDRRDRVTVVACDSECESLGAPRPVTADIGAEAVAWLNGQAPAGASDLVGSMREGARALEGAAGRERWVLYVGDGLASAGFRRAGDVESALADDPALDDVRMTTVAIGGDADATVLAAAARGGAGSFVAYRPGSAARSVAQETLDTTRGAGLANATLELPSGLLEVAPAVLPTLRSGEETLISARMTGPVQGDIVLRGTVAGAPFEQRYPVAFDVSTAAGNRFVPKLWASLAIEELERQGRGEDRARVVAMSQGYGVLSRETSLLVLESQAMFDAFGVQRGSAVEAWTGEEEVDETSAVGALVATASGEMAGGLGMGMATGTTGHGGGVASGPMAAAPMADSAPAAEPKKATVTKGDTNADKAKQQPITPRDARAATEDRITMEMDESMARGRRGGGYFARRVWFRVASVQAYSGVPSNVTAVIEAAEDALEAAPDSRERHRTLVQALAFAGDLERGLAVAESWHARDALDPEAMGYIADFHGRRGDRTRALRTLGSLVDLTPDAADLHQRMVGAFERTGRMTQACAHRIALHSLKVTDATATGGALRCLRALGREHDARIVLRGLASDALRLSAEKLAAAPGVDLSALGTASLRGDLVVRATWDGGADLDVSLIAGDGKRISALGGRKGVAVVDGTSTGREAFALPKLVRGRYLIELARVLPAKTGFATAPSAGPVRGTLEITALGVKRSVPFEVIGDKVAVSLVDITMDSRLEEVMR